MNGRPALTRRLALEAPEDAPDGGGGAVRLWRRLGTHWAALRAVSASEVVAHGAEASRVTHRALIRWAPPGAAARPNPAQRFTEGGRVFEVVGVSEADPARRYLTCWLREGGER